MLFLFLQICVFLLPLDAVSSFSTSLASAVSLLVIMSDNNSLWWFDGLAGLLIALYTLCNGLLSMKNARVSLLLLLLLLLLFIIVVIVIVLLLVLLFDIVTIYYLLLLVVCLFVCLFVCLTTLFIFTNID